MRARQIAVWVCAALAAAQLTAQSGAGQGIDLGPLQAGATHRQSISVANKCETAKVVEISHNVPYLSMPSIVTLPPGMTAIELTLAIPAGRTGNIAGAITLTFPGDAGCQPRTAALAISAQIQPAAGQQTGGPESETWYDDATGAFDEGRDLADDAERRALRRESGAKEQAQKALDRLTAASDAVRAGQASGEIGEETAAALRTFITKSIARAGMVLAGVTGDDPRDEPPPVIYGEEIDKDVDAYEGGFAPTQGVWQDDEDFTDFPGKQLTRMSPSQLKAELHMIAGRPSLLVGIRDSRNEIYFKGTARGTINVPVKARFTLVQGNLTTQIHETNTLGDLVPLDGSTGSPKPFKVRVLATNGLPANAGFLFSAGKYRIDAELIRADTNAPTGIRVSVEGEAVDTTTPTVLFVPVNFAPWGAATRAQLIEATQKLAVASRSDVPVIFPIKPDSLVTNVAPLQDLSALFRDVRRRARELGVEDVERATRDVMAATLADKFGTISVLGGHGRIFVVMNDYDFDETYRGRAAGGTSDAAAYAMSRKVMVGRPDIDTMTVAHEIIHTLPFVWAEESMMGLFGKEWHNKSTPLAHGIDVVRTVGMRRDKSRAVMGPAGYVPWIAQGTYWHLIDFLRAPVDPELLLVSGLLGRVTRGYRATLSPGYQLLGEADLTAGTPTAGQFVIVVRDARGATIAQYPFDPVWQQPDLSEPRSVVSFSHRVPDVPGVGGVEIRGPGGAVLASRRISARPPMLRVVTPAANRTAALANGRLRVAWEASDPDGDRLLFNVLYSADNGRRWDVVSHEQTESFFDLPLRGRPRQARVKVVATDGMRSVEREVAFGMR